MAVRVCLRVGLNNFLWASGQPPQQARRDEESDFFSPLRSLDGANTIWELDRGGEEGSITPAKIVDWISDTLWGGEPSDDDDRLEVPPARACVVAFAGVGHVWTSVYPQT